MARSPSPGPVRPGVPPTKPAAPPLPAAAHVSPPAPPVAPRRIASDVPPPDDGWSDADATLEKPRTEALKLPDPLRAEIRVAVRAAVDDAVAPLTRAVNDLTAALDKERRERVDRDAQLAREIASRVAASLPPPAASAPATPNVVNAIPVSFSVAPAPPAGAAPITARSPSDIPISIAPAPYVRFDASPYSGPMPSELDGSRRRRAVAWTVALLVLVLVGGVGLMTILSRAN